MQDPKCICIWKGSNWTKCVALCCALRGTKPSPSNSRTQNDLINDSIYSSLEKNAIPWDMLCNPVMHVYLELFRYVKFHFYLYIFYKYIICIYVYSIFIYTDSTSTHPFNNVCNFCICQTWTPPAIVITNHITSHKHVAKKMNTRLSHVILQQKSKNSRIFCI